MKTQEVFYLLIYYHPSLLRHQPPRSLQPSSFSFLTDSSIQKLYRLKCHLCWIVFFWASFSYLDYCFRSYPGRLKETLLDFGGSSLPLEFYPTSSIPNTMIIPKVWHFLFSNYFSQLFRNPRLPFSDFIQSITVMLHFFLLDLNLT